MEREDIVAARGKYLRIIEKKRKSDHPRLEICMDETWVNQNECVAKCWSISDGMIGLKLKTGRRERFIILHAGGDDGFVCLVDYLCFGPETETKATITTL